MPRAKKKKRGKRTARAVLAATLARMERFAQEYVIDLNGTQAAIRAGYAPKSAHVQASRLLSIDKVALRVAELKAAIAKKYEVTPERVLREVSRIAFGDRRGLYHADGQLKLPHEWDDDTAALVASVESHQTQIGEGSPITITTNKVKSYDKLNALEKCMAYLGMHKTAGVQGESGLVLMIKCSDGKAVR